MKIPATPPDFQATLAKLPADRLLAILEQPRDPAPGGRYRHWDKLRRLTPPGDLSHEEWWLGIKLARQSLLHPVPLVDGRGVPFKFALPDPALEMLHEIDRDASGRLQSASEAIANADTRDYYLVKSLMEEAITSSQLEGASTTRYVAAQMIRSGRPPRDRSERMIFNNYQAIQHIRSFVGRPLTPSRILELHQILADRTMDEATQAGRLRRADERVVVIDEVDNVLHTPPPAHELESRLLRMCDFANGANESKRFMHPVVRAVVLHFWLAYDHPFVDGNGRTARALFYWSMLSQGYWLCEYLSISRILRKAPAQYGRSFLYTESDDNDMTYFLLAQLAVIRQAIVDLHAYLDKKLAETKAVEALLRQSIVLNHRQLALLSHALKHPDDTYTIEAHKQSHNVVYQTARTDLLDLEQKGLLIRGRAGKTYYFVTPPDLASRLGKLGRPVRRRTK